MATALRPPGPTGRPRLRRLRPRLADGRSHGCCRPRPEQRQGRCHRCCRRRPEQRKGRGEWRDPRREGRDHRLRFVTPAAVADAATGPGTATCTARSATGLATAAGARRSLLRGARLGCAGRGLPWLGGHHHQRPPVSGAPEPRRARGGRFWGGIIWGGRDGRVAWEQGVRRGAWAGRCAGVRMGCARRHARQRGPPTYCHRCGRDSTRTSTPSPRATSRCPHSRTTSAETQRRARRQTACAPVHPGAPPSTLALALTSALIPRAPPPRCFTTDPSVRQEECDVCDAAPSLLVPVAAPHEHTPVPDWVRSEYSHGRYRHSHGGYRHSHGKPSTSTRRNMAPLYSRAP